jgi:UDPglucose 6-dehydrogenase
MGGGPEVASGSTVGIPGLSYEPETPVVEDGRGVALAMRLRDAGCLVRVFDPAALEAAGTLLGTEAAPASMEACAREADVLVITTPWPEFSILDPVSLRRAGERSVIIDCWRVWPKERFKDAADVVYLDYGDDWRSAGGDTDSLQPLPS